MLHGRRLDHALEHVNGSRYALVHAVAKRARQITLWMTADPAELRAEAAPPPMAGEMITRDPVALSEAEILDGEVIVHWDPDGEIEEQEIPTAALLETDPLLLEGLDGDDDEVDLDDEADLLTPALAQAIEGTAAEVAATDDEAEDADDDEAIVAEDVVALDDTVDDAPVLVPADEIEEISLEDVDEGDDDENEPEG
jgi:DNA-directed RNA polymerase subunit K/omega